MFLFKDQTLIFLLQQPQVYQVKIFQICFKKHSILISIINLMNNYFQVFDFLHLYQDQTLF